MMKKLRLLVFLICAASSPALADSTINNLGAGSALTGTEQIPMFQSANPAVTTTPNALLTYEASKVSGDCTQASGGAITCTKTNGSAFGALATVAPGTGVTAGLSNAATGSGSPVFATSPTLVTPALGTPSSATLTNATGLPLSGISNLGSGVAGAAVNTLSSAGGLTTTIASGTAALGTGAISSGACASAVTVAATNVATTDVITDSFNGDPTGVTGYAPVTTGMLTIIEYPTSGNVNFKVCNNTNASVTPGAITLNWRVLR